MRIGVVVSMMPVAVKSRAPDRWPSWKIHTMAPKVADRLSRLRITAFTGTSRLPDIRNRTVKVTTTMARAASGSSPNSESLESTSWAEGPPTVTWKGAGEARTAWTRASPSADTGSTEGTTESHVESAAWKRTLDGPGGA